MTTEAQRSMTCSQCGELKWYKNDYGKCVTCIITNLHTPRSERKSK